MFLFREGLLPHSQPMLIFQPHPPAFRKELPKLGQEIIPFIASLKKKKKIPKCPVLKKASGCIAGKNFLHPPQSITQAIQRMADCIISKYSKDLGYGLIIPNLWLECQWVKEGEGLREHLTQGHELNAHRRLEVKQ